MLKRFFFAALVASTFTSNSVFASDRVGDVPASDRGSMRSRVESLNTVYLGFGTGSFQNMGVSPSIYDLAIGYNWEVNPRAAIRVLGTSATGSDFKTSIVDGLLGLNLFLNNQDSSPYVFGGLGFGFSGSAASSATTMGGFAGALGLGYQLFRTSSTHFDITAEYHTIFGNNTIGSPGDFVFRVGVLF